MKFKLLKLFETPGAKGRPGNPVYAVQCNAGDGWLLVGQHGRAFSFPSERKARDLVSVLERRFPRVSSGDEEDGISEGVYV